jgi:hypothetical protein
MATPTLYHVIPGSGKTRLTLDQVWAQKGAGPLASGYSHIFPTEAGGKPYLVGIDSKGKGTAFQFQAKAPWLAASSAKIDLGGACDVVEPFVLGNQPYVLAYVAAKYGTFSFFPLAADASSQIPFTYSRPHAPGQTAGFTVTQPIVINGSIFVLCYSFATGNVNIYSLSVISTPQAGTAPGSPPLLANYSWVHQWAKSWTHFAFFRMGGSNFFFKINVGPKPNTNIDHVLDDPTQGTVEVGTFLKLDNAQKLDIVEPFYMGAGDPYFLTYQKDGSTILNKFHGDCQGWDVEGTQDTIAGASQIVPFRVGGDTYVLFY